MTDQVPSVYETPTGLRQLANYLRSPYGVKSRSAIEHEKRVDYFKGKRMIECILAAKKWPKSLPKITERTVAVSVAQLLVKGEYFHRSEKVEGKKGYLVYSQKNYFEETGYYTWMFAGSMVWSNMATGVVIALVVGFTLLPVWPDFAKRILWYFSVTFLIVTLVFVLIRFLLFLIMWIIGYEFWVFPRLFDESLTFQESFKPIYSLEKGSTGQGYYRIGLLILIGGFIYWASSQPTEFDGFLKAQKEFIDDLYSGNLLADVAHDNSIGKLQRRDRVPVLEDLLREIEEDERIAQTPANEPVNATDESRLDSGNDNDNDSVDGDSHDQDQDGMIDNMLNDDENQKQEIDAESQT